MTASVLLRQDDVPQSVLCLQDAWKPIELGYVWTLKEDDEEESMQRFPAKPHAWHLIRWWQGRHPVLAQQGWNSRFMFVKKTRRMLATWTFSWCILHDAMTFPGAVNGIGSIRFESVEWILVRRLKLMYDNLPEDIFPSGKPRMEARKGIIEFPEIGSQIIGFPHGSEQWRGYTFRNVMLDECGHWDVKAPFLDTYYGLRPAARRIVAFSSPEEGSGFKRLCLSEEV